MSVQIILRNLMCNSACLFFVADALFDAKLTGKDFLEVGSYNVNGSAQTIIKERKPWSYIGVDISPGPGVDKICNCLDLLEEFGKESFDYVITTEMLEHVEDWRGAINNLKGVLKVGGEIILTTRSYGFPLHGYPDDHWRFECADMMEIFSDFEIKTVCKDPQDIGVFLHAKKVNAPPIDLSNIKLYNINTDRRQL